MRSAIAALVLAFIAVQGASFLQSAPSADVMKGEYVTEPALRPQAVLAPQNSWLAMLPVVFVGPLVMAALCYLLAKRIV